MKMSATSNQDSSIEPERGERASRTVPYEVKYVKDPASLSPAKDFELVSTSKSVRAKDRSAKGDKPKRPTPEKVNPSHSTRVRGKTDGGTPQTSYRSRNLFPLPPPPNFDTSFLPADFPGARVVKRRLERAHHVDDIVRDMVVSLNSLCPGGSPEPNNSPRPTQAQVDALPGGPTK